MGLNDFLIELQARLDEKRSKENIDTDIVRLQKKLNKIKKTQCKTLFY